MLSTEKLKSKRGISLPIAMAITAVLVILSASLIAIALTSITTTSSSVNSRQAYLNARSAVEYAYAYYSDSDNVPDISQIDEQYIVMNDKEGGTTSQGASFVDTLDAANEYNTYVVAKYVKGATAQDDDGVKLVAYSKSTDAFGGKSQEIHIGALYYLNKLANKHRLVNTNVDLSTDPTPQDQPPGYIQMHAKQYPGQTWVPFYYVWTFKDEANLYKNTNNLFGLESLYHDYNGNYKENGQYSYTWVDDDGNEHEGGKIADALTTNYNAGTVHPCGAWNVHYKADGSEDVGNINNGPTSFFAPREGSTNWYDATYKIVDGQVNYFNLIITKKGKVLNGPNGEFYEKDTQSCEMFHLWYMTSADPHIYIEFLKPGLIYRPGASWNGHDGLDDRFLVYVKNSKTTLHFKVKGVGDGESGIEAPGNAPQVLSLNVRGASITTEDTSLDGYVQAISTGNVGAYLEGSAQHQLETGIKGRTNPTQYFYGGESGKARMMYEGQGWWVLNIATNKRFTIKVAYYDASNNYCEAESDINPSALSDTGDIYMVALTTNRGNETFAYGSEKRACTRIGVDYKSYTTVHVKTSDFGSAVAPYLDYYSQKTSSTMKRTLQELIDDCRAKYNSADFEETSFNNLQTALNHAVDVLNASGKTDDDYQAEITAIKAVKLVKKGLDNTIYGEYKSLVKKCTDIIDSQFNKDDTVKEAIYDTDVLNVFRTDEDGYKKAKALIDSKTIENDPVTYTSTEVLKLIDELDTKLKDLQAHKLNKDDITRSINTAKKYKGNVLYKTDYLELLDAAIASAENVKKLGPTQAAIDAQKTALDGVVADRANHRAQELQNTTKLSELIDLSKAALDGNINCTEATYKALDKEVKAAEALWADTELTDDKLQAEYDKLKPVYDEFLIYKPTGYDLDDGTYNSESDTNDKLLSQYKYRLWLKDFNVGTTFNSYVDDSNGVQNFSSPISIQSFTVTAYDPKGGSFTIFGRQFKQIPSQNLLYYDVENASIAKLRFSVTFTNGEVYETKVDTYDGIGGSAGFLTDGNVVFTFKNIGHYLETGTSSVTGKQYERDVYYVKTSRGKTSELFIDCPSGATVEVMEPDGTTKEYTAVSDGKEHVYQVCRFVYTAPVTDADGNKHSQKVRVKYQSAEAGGTICSEWFNTQMGQFVVKLNDTAETRTEIEDNSVTIHIPYDVPSLAGSSLTRVAVVINGTEYAPELVDGEYLYKTNFTGKFTFYVYRYYYNRYNKLTVSKSNGMAVSKAGVLRLTYSTTTKFTASQSIGKAFSVPVKSTTDVRMIKPFYTIAKSSSKTGSSSELVSGIVSSTFVDKVLAVPLSVAADTLSYNVTGYFDYFGQSGVDSLPTKNLGQTVIWIDCSTGKLKTLVDSGAVPRVYAWETRDVYGTSKDYPTTGAWPGDVATRVEDSPYYYVVTSSNAKQLIITSSKDKSKRYGGNPNDGNAIYLDMTDTWNGEDIYKNGKPVNNYYDRPGGCDKGNGNCCLYTIIDAAVINGYSHTMGDGNSVRNRYYWGGDVEKALGYDKGAVVNANGGNSHYETDGKWSWKVTYKYRAKFEDSPRTYKYTRKNLDATQMTATKLRMAFVGGSKLRIQNTSYWNSYGTFQQEGYQPDVSDFTASNNSSVKISVNNLFGGNRGNQGSNGRVGDSDLLLMYDWYEYKIPVDQSDEYTFQIQGLQYVNKFKANGVVNGRTVTNYYNNNPKQWYDEGYMTDDKYTNQIHNAYGDVWLVMHDLSTEQGIFSNYALYTTSPETVEVEDNQPIYFQKPADNSEHPISKVTVTATGSGGAEDFVMTDYKTNMLTTSIPADKPFLTFKIDYADGTSKTYRTTLQGNDMILFEQNLSGSYSWTNYETDERKLERLIYEAQSVYHGYVIAKEYDSNGNVVSKSNEDSYKFPQGIYDNVVSGHIDGDGRPITSGITVGTVENYVSAYKNLFKTLADARAYIDEGRNYPEFIAAGRPDIYDDNSIAALKRIYDSSENTYVSSKSLSDIVKANEKLRAAISNVSLATSSKAPIVLYDTQRLSNKGYDIKIQYSKTEGGALEAPKTVTYKTTEGQPIVFLEPDENEENIYNVRFIITSPDGEVDYGIEQAKVPLIDGAWVYVYQPVYPPDRLQDTSYWVQNSSTDYREISNTTLMQVSGSDFGVYDMTPSRTSIHQAVPVNESQDAAIQQKYRPLTLYFRYDTTVEFEDSSNNYTIPAGAYSFDKDYVTTQYDADKGNSSGPFIYKEVETNNWKPRLDLFSNFAKAYFTNPANYGQLDGAADAVTLSDWVDTSEDTKKIVAGIKSNGGPVNMTVNDGFIEYGRQNAYKVSGGFYFRWEGNEALKLYEDLKVEASEFTIALSGPLDATNNYDKHFYIGTRDDADSMDITFITDINVKYQDMYGDYHEFIIREGAYTISRPEGRDGYIADLCDMDYWESMQYVKIRDSLSTEGGYNSTNGKGRFREPVFTN